MYCENCEYRCYVNGNIICHHPLVDLLGTCPIKKKIENEIKEK